MSEARGRAARRTARGRLAVALAAAATVGASAGAGGAWAQEGTRRVPPPPPGAVGARGGAGDADDRADVDARAAARLTDSVLSGGATAGDDAPGDPARADPRRGATLRVYLMTFGQGDAVWERFGHNALRIEDTVTGEDVAWNWGMFDFAQPNFVTRFLTGDTKYWVEGFDANALAAHYARQENRSVWIQELALTDAQKAALQDYVRWNASESHRFYRYDYYRDNCSTRVRDAIDRVTGGALRRALSLRPTTGTWRSHTRRLVAGDAPTYTGIQLALGRGADERLTAWEAGFLPVQLMEAVRTVRVARPSGGVAPLVLNERKVFTATRPAERTEPPTAWWAFLAAGLLLGAVLAALGRAAARGGAGARAAFAGVAGTWTLVTGLAGTALLLAGTVTKHAPYMGRNLNLLGVSPLALLLGVLVVVAMAARGGSSRARWSARAARLAWLVAALTVLGAVVVSIPGIGQRSLELFLLLVPVHVALAWGLSRAAVPAALGALGARDA